MGKSKTAHTVWKCSINHVEAIDVFLFHRGDILGDSYCLIIKVCHTMTQTLLVEQMSIWSLQLFLQIFVLRRDSYSKSINSWSVVAAQMFIRSCLGPELFFQCPTAPSSCSTIRSKWPSTAMMADIILQPVGFPNPLLEHHRSGGTWLLFSRSIVKWCVLLRWFCQRQSVTKRRLSICGVRDPKMVSLWDSSYPCQSVNDS